MDVDDLNPASDELDLWEELPEGDGVLILSPEKRILSANLQAERLLRIKLNRGQLLPLELLVSEKDLPQAGLALQEALGEGISSANLLGHFVLNPDHSIYLIYSIDPLYNQKEKIIAVIFTLRENTTARAWTAWSTNGLGIEFDSFLDNLAEAVFTINTRWRIIGFNRRAEEVTGFKRHEVLGRFCWDIFKSDRCQTDCPLKATLDDGITRTDQDVRMVNAGGRNLNVLVNTSIFRDKKGTVAGAIEFFRPLTLASQPAGVKARRVPPAIEIIGQSPPMAKLIHLLPDIAASEANVVIEGDSGTGKELFAKAIHYQSPRAQGPFVPVNCSALAESLLESELFGHVKAAFTGAIASKVGRFELAKGGTLFLDEIGEFKPELQVKLLRVLEERVFWRVGGTQPIPIDARIIVATSRNLKEAVRQGRFREDLYYRLRTVPLFLPPLRDRPEDIPPLVEHFIHQFNQKYRKQIRGLDPKVMALLQKYHWPGNVRELQRVLEYAFVFVKGHIISQKHLPELEEPLQEPRLALNSSPVLTSLWEDEREAIQRALQKARGRRQVAARLLGISRSSLWRKMRAHNLS
ncbi:MAG: sigma 54-interacting transcriptional regulator [Syntrophobacterales bacterium]|jgi:PAS domain S-box-containing protein